MDMNVKNLSVLGLGDNVVDKYEHLRIMYPGGNAVNFAVYAKKMNCRVSAYMGYFGDDAEAEHVMASLRLHSVDISHCRRLAGENGCARVTVQNGDRVFLGSNEGGIRGKTPFILDSKDLAYMKSFDLVFSGCYGFMESQLPAVRQLGIPVAFDFSDDSSDHYYSQIAPMVDYAFMSCAELSEDEIRRKLAWVASLGPSFVCASRGALGCVAYAGRGFYVQPALPVENMVDTMGAGDALLTAFLIEHFSVVKAGAPPDIAGSMRRAAAFAAQICSAAGSWGCGAPY